MRKLLDEIANYGCIGAGVIFWSAALIGLIWNVDVGVIQVICGVVIALVFLCFALLEVFKDGSSREPRALLPGRAQTADDLDHMEQALSVKLPTAYRQFMIEFPVRYDRGTNRSDIWNDITAVIEANWYLRESGHPWPDNYVAIGRRDSEEREYVLDLSTTPVSVGLWFSAASRLEGRAFDSRTSLEELAESLRRDAALAGLDPDADRRPPVPRAARTLRERLEPLGCWLKFILLAVALGTCHALVSSG